MLIDIPQPRLSTARSFNGTSSDTVQATMASTSDQLFSALTIAAWIKSTSSGTKAIVRRGDQGSTPFVSYGLAQLAGGVAGSVGDGWSFMLSLGSSITHLIADNNSAGGNPVIFGRWAHLAGMWDGATMRVFVNGVEKKNTGNAGSMAALDTRFSIGYDISFGEYWLGSLAHLAVWNLALNAGEIFKLSRGLLPSAIRRQALSLYYPLTGLSSPEQNVASWKYPGVVTGTQLAGGPLVVPEESRIRYFMARNGGAVNPLALNAAMAAWAGSLGRGTQKTIAAAPAAWAGALTKSAQKSSGLVAAMASFAGALSTAKVKVQALAASMAAWSATLARQAQKQVAANMATWSGTLARFTSKTIAASMAAWSGVLAKQARKGLTAAMAAFSGALGTTKVKVQALAAGMAAFAGGLSRQTGKSMAASMAAWSATLRRGISKGLTGTMAAWAAALNKSTLKSLIGSMAAWLGNLVGLKSGTLPGPFVGCSGVRTYPMLMTSTATVFPGMAAGASRSYPSMIAGSFQVLGGF